MPGDAYKQLPDALVAVANKAMVEPMSASFNVASLLCATSARFLFAILRQPPSIPSVCQGGENGALEAAIGSRVHSIMWLLPSLPTVPMISVVA
jgi:hypothetical protein